MVGLIACTVSTHNVHTLESLSDVVKILLPSSVKLTYPHTTPTGKHRTKRVLLGLF